METKWVIKENLWVHLSKNWQVVNSFNGKHFQASRKDGKLKKIQWLHKLQGKNFSKCRFLV